MQDLSEPTASVQIGDENAKTGEALQRDERALRWIESAAQETKPLAHPDVVFRRLYQKGLLARSRAEAQTPMVMRDKTKLAAAIGTAIL